MSVSIRRKSPATSAHTVFLWRLVLSYLSAASFADAIIVLHDVVLLQCRSSPRRPSTVFFVLRLWEDVEEEASGVSAGMQTLTLELSTFMQLPS
jgi:hypothetical protein